MVEMKGVWDEIRYQMTDEGGMGNWGNFAGLNPLWG